MEYLLMQIKVTGPVSFIHFSFPVEAGQLTWSFFFSLILIDDVLCGQISLASGICYLIFIGSLTVRFDQSDYKLLVIGQVKSDSFGVTVAKLRAVKNQSVYPPTKSNRLA